MWAILERGRVGQTYLIGADGELDNRAVVAMLLAEFGRAADDFDTVTDRIGHDLRYAIDASLLREELGWRPRYLAFANGSPATVTVQAWYAGQRSVVGDRCRQGGDRTDATQSPRGVEEVRWRSADRSPGPS